MTTSFDFAWHAWQPYFIFDERKQQFHFLYGILGEELTRLYRDIPTVMFQVALTAQLSPRTGVAAVVLTLMGLTTVLAAVELVIFYSDNIRMGPDMCPVCC